MPANLVFHRKIWGARDNGIPPRSTPAIGIKNKELELNQKELELIKKN